MYVCMYKYIIYTHTHTYVRIVKNTHKNAYYCYIHTNIHTYIDTYIHKYIHIHTSIKKIFTDEEMATMGFFHLERVSMSAK
uniref:Uncharacterized protein n=1 Tax=Glossina morsitans morsitans TaxID=37546 RepID=A0A1B0G770_GLOMM